MRVTAETKAATRQRIMDEAGALFAQKGFEATTTRDIAHVAGIAVGTLFNYFPTKEAIVACLVGEALAEAHAPFVPRLRATAIDQNANNLPSFDEALFALVVAELRAMQPFRLYVTAVLETTFSPLASANRSDEADRFRVAHLEIAQHAAAQHGLTNALSPVAWQLYWTLYMGVLSFWSEDLSHEQESTLALLDQSLQMFVGWLVGTTVPAQ